MIVISQKAVLSFSSITHLRSQKLSTFYLKNATRHVQCSMPQLAGKHIDLDACEQRTGPNKMQH